MLTNTDRSSYIEREFGSLVGKTVAGVRPLTTKECNAFAWEHSSDVPWVIIFTDGTALVPSSDPEGNDCGFAFVLDTK